MDGITCVSSTASKRLYVDDLSLGIPGQIAIILASQLTVTRKSEKQPKEKKREQKDNKGE